MSLQIITRITKFIYMCRFIRDTRDQPLHLLLSGSESDPLIQIRLTLAFHPENLKLQPVHVSISIYNFDPQSVCPCNRQHFDLCIPHSALILPGHLSKQNLCTVNSECIISSGDDFICALSR